LNLLCPFPGELFIPIDKEKPSVGDLVMLLSPWRDDTGLVRVVLGTSDHRQTNGTYNRFLKLNDDTESWPASYVRILSKAKK
jgi:hypothetical protein